MAHNKHAQEYKETHITVESRFIGRVTINNTKTAEMLDTPNCLQHHIKNAKATKFLSQSAFYTSKGRTCKVLRLYDFGSSFMLNFVALTASSTFCAYLITKIGNRNLKANFLSWKKSFAGLLQIITANLSLLSSLQADFLSSQKLLQVILLQKKSIL